MRTNRQRAVSMLSSIGVVDIEGKSWMSLALAAARQANVFRLKLRASKGYDILSYRESAASADETADFCRAIALGLDPDKPWLA